MIFDFLGGFFFVCIFALLAFIYTSHNVPKVCHKFSSLVFSRVATNQKKKKKITMAFGKKRAKLSA